MVRIVKQLPVKTTHWPQVEECCGEDGDSKNGSDGDSMDGGAAHVEVGGAGLHIVRLGDRDETGSSVAGSDLAIEQSRTARE
jgi:hypothetical protein